MNLLLIDGDEVAYKAASTSIENDPDRFERSEEEVVNKIENTIAMYLNYLEETFGITITDYILFIGGSNNFRKTLFPSYKANRKYKETPPLLSFARNYMVKEFNAFVAQGVETDDAIVATYYQWLESPFFNPEEDAIFIASQDKDFQQVPCALFDTYHSRLELRIILETGANRFFYKQMLMGDKSDGIVGIPKVGVKTAEKILGDDLLQSEYSLMRKVFKKYKEVYKSKARQKFVENYTMLRMIRKGIQTPKETFKVSNQ